MIKVFYEVLPATLGRVMYRINRGLKKYAPDWVEFTIYSQEADLQILDCIGAGSLSFIYNKNYVLLQECLMAGTMPKNWLEVFKSAKLVASYLDIPRLLNSSDFNFLRVPVGVDPYTFVTNPLQERRYDFMTTGYVAESESIKEVYEAVTRAKGQVVHVGSNFRYGSNFHWYENISDYQLVDLYNSSIYISGLRRSEGFEVPIIEGMLCGARGVTFNAEHYSYWFGDLVEYIEEGKPEFVSEQIFDLLTKKEYRPVSVDEQVQIKEKFSWEVVAAKFWDAVRIVI